MPTINLSQSAVDIIFYSVAFIESDADNYPTAEGLAIYVNNAMPDESVTTEDIAIASAVIAQKYPDIFGDMKSLDVEIKLGNAFKDAMSSRIPKEKSFIKDFAIIFTLVLGGYLVFKGRKSNA